MLQERSRLRASVAFLSGDLVSVNRSPLDIVLRGIRTDENINLPNYIYM